MGTYFRGSDEDEILNSSNRLTDGFFYCSFNIIEYLSYPKSKTTGPDHFIAKRMILGLPCRVMLRTST